MTCNIWVERRTSELYWLAFVAHLNIWRGTDEHVKNDWIMSLVLFLTLLDASILIAKISQGIYLKILIITNKNNTHRTVLHWIFVLLFFHRVLAALARLPRQTTRSWFPLVRISLYMPVIPRRMQVLDRTNQVSHRYETNTRVVLAQNPSHWTMQSLASFIKVRKRCWVYKIHSSVCYSFSCLQIPEKNCQKTVLLKIVLRRLSLPFTVLSILCHTHMSSPLPLSSRLPGLLHLI